MIRIVTDSTCDLEKETIEKLNVEVLPLNLVLDGKTYRDEIDISRQEFYERLPDCKEHPTTSLPSLGQIEEVYRKFNEVEGTEIISIHISETLSGTVNTIQSAAKNFTEGLVTVVDGGQLSIGTGFQVELAAEMAKRGENLATILAALNSLRERIFVAAALDGMEYLRRSGRVNGIVSGIGSIIKLKPLLTMYNGIAKSEIARTRRGAFRKLEQLLQSRLPIERLVILHSNASQDGLKEWIQIATSVTGLENFPIINITPVIGNHIGPGAIGFGLIQATQK